MGREHFSGRKTKNAHVNGILAVNVSKEDREIGRAVLNWVVRRRGKWSSNRAVEVVGCYDFEQPVVISRWLKKIHKQKEEDKE
jgi:hypothetical protein